jgi:YidC/Oxa1 family membrane protein insertase
MLPGQDFGIAVIVLTLLIRVVFFPLSIKAIKSQRAMSFINPQLAAIKEKFKNDKTAQSAAIMKLYKDNNINPFAGCLPLLIQLPILIALYSAFNTGFQPEKLTLLYDFIKNPGIINKMFLGIVDISVKNPFLTLMTGGLQFIQSRQSTANTNPSGQGLSKEMSALNSQMLYFFPVLIIIIGWNMPAALLLYWITTTVFSIFEQIYIKKNHS